MTIYNFLKRMVLPLAIIYNLSITSNYQKKVFSYEEDFNEDSIYDKAILNLYRFRDDYIINYEIYLSNKDTDPQKGFVKGNYNHKKGFVK